MTPLGDSPKLPVKCPVPIKRKVKFSGTFSVSAVIEWNLMLDVGSCGPCSWDDGKVVEEAEEEEEDEVGRGEEGEDVICDDTAVTTAAVVAVLLAAS